MGQEKDKAFQRAEDAEGITQQYREMPSMDQPEEGFYKLRLVRGGPWCAVKIWFAAKGEDQTPQWQCLVNGHEADVWEIWPWVGGRGISEEEYKRLEPQRSPDKPIDKLKTKPVF